MNGLGPRRRRLFLVAVGLVAAAGATSLLRFVTFSWVPLFALVPVAPLATAIGLLLAASLWSRRALAKTLVALAALWVLALPGLVVPRIGCSVQGTTGDEGVVVYSHNVLREGGDPAAAAAGIDAADADVVLLQEADADFAERLLAALRLDYPHVAASEATGNLSLLTMSRWPLGDVDDTWERSRDRNPVLVATVQSPAGDIRIANVHLTSPTFAEHVARHELDWELLRTLTADTDLFMGDFNATSAHRRYRTFVAEAGSDAQVAAGCGFGTSWSPLRQGPSILALDHAVTGAGVEAVGYEVLDYHGSDHRAVAVRVRRISTVVGVVDQ
ncbi:MAG: endonuclease/exonuclease/phosphatase family protein [Actinomycetota bacterium]